LELLQDPSHLNQILEIGAQKAEAVANQTLADVYERLGLIARR
jgi:tryptophanyl-tRNA synthetase